jgi:hypothetical protein
MSQFSRCLACVALAVGLAMALSTQLFSQTAREVYEGQVDGCSLTNVSGWALHDKKETNVTVAVNGKTLAASVPADIPRPDVARATNGAQKSGFDFKFPAPLMAGDKVELKFTNGTAIGGPQGLSCTAK